MKYSIRNRSSKEEIKYFKVKGIDLIAFIKKDMSNELAAKIMESVNLEEIKDTEMLSGEVEFKMELVVINNWNSLVEGMKVISHSYLYSKDAIKVLYNHLKNDLI